MMEIRFSDTLVGYPLTSLRAVITSHTTEYNFTSYHS